MRVPGGISPAHSLAAGDAGTGGCRTGPRSPSPAEALPSGKRRRQRRVKRLPRVRRGDLRHWFARAGQAQRPPRPGCPGILRALPRSRSRPWPRRASLRPPRRSWQGRGEAARAERRERPGPAGTMLPAGRGGRAAAALRAALGAGEERQRELERRAERGRALLRPCAGHTPLPPAPVPAGRAGRAWSRCSIAGPGAVCSPRAAEEEEEQPQAQPGSGAGHENRPSPKELEELELLNRALEKALKVRKSILKIPLEAPGATGKKLAGDGPAGKRAEEQQVLVPVEDVPESTKVGTGSKKPGSSKKPSAYHLKAPYRTDPDVKKPQRKAPARCVSQGPRTSGKSSSKGSATEVCAPAEPQKTLGLSQSAPNEKQCFSVGDSAGGKNSVPAGQELFNAGKKSCGFLGESSKKEDAAGASGRSPSSGTGTLQEKGCQLKLPLPYRKAYARNSRAWEKCHLCRTSADAAAARARFMERIQTTFCSPKADFSPAEIEEELRVLQDVPSRLRQYVEAETADPPTLQGEYESLLTLEGLQTTVAQCLQKLQLLRAALESQLRLRPDCTGDVGSCSPSCVPARGQMCDTAGVLALPLLCYSSFQELRDLFALKLQVSMLHQEIALQKVLMAELLPVLEPSPCPARLFRAIHTQLCQGGRSFPVLVRDELGD
ncbi:tubulin epsilon and delta complex protein 2 [Empidonax traillii]|uniref:tubulin epsilon and delta complex protein 2 n=1 Tax=Empidonax traillii TaxID=164674 RepID=UPI000FFCF9C7|nr:tubulin epsilon and delta complex protein 2 [Empidonax traillii]